MEWAEAGATEGSIVLAEYQSQGRGRHGRQWLAATGRNLLFSIVLRPRLPASRLSLLTLAASLAVAETLERAATPLSVKIEWPNDVMVEGRKCCGMLLESAMAGKGDALVILGIGLNVNQDQFPPALENHATSLLLETGQQVARAPLMAGLLQCLETKYMRVHDDPLAIRGAYEARLDGVGSVGAVRAHPSLPPLSGTILGIAETGALRLLTDHGEQHVSVGHMEEPANP